MFCDVLACPGSRGLSARLSGVTEDDEARLPFPRESFRNTCERVFATDTELTRRARPTSLPRCGSCAAYLERRGAGLARASSEPVRLSARARAVWATCLRGQRANRGEGRQGRRLRNDGGDALPAVAAATHVPDHVVVGSRRLAGAPKSVEVLDEGLGRGANLDDPHAVLARQSLLGRIALPPHPEPRDDR